MQAVRLSAVVGVDHRLQLDVPPEIPAGDVEIIILASVSPGHPQPKFGSLRDFNDWLAQQPSSGRSKEDIDRYLAEERASWE